MGHSRPLAIDLFAGLGGFSEGLMAEGFDCIGFDIERHEYGEHRYPAQLVLQDVLTLDGRQFADADLIVASPPCQEFSYMAMPWRRAKQIAATLRGERYQLSLGHYTYGFPKGYKGSRTRAELTALFDACFRIQREASAAAGHYIPLIVENVKGAQPWVGRARWHYGSYYLWGDVPALMPMSRGVKNSGGSWFNVAHNTTSGLGQNPDGRKVVVQNWSRYRETGEVSPHWNQQGGDWFGDSSPGSLRSFSSRSSRRKAASALIAKIPLELSRHIGRVFRPYAEAT